MLNISYWLLMSHLGGDWVFSQCDSIDGTSVGIDEKNYKVLIEITKTNSNPNTNPNTKLSRICQSDSASSFILL